MMVMPDALGLSKQGREHLLPYAATVFNMFGPDNALRRAAVAQMAPHVEWIASQCKREALTDDGIGAAIHAGADAGEVTRQEAELLVRSLLSAGFDTTVHCVGAAIRQLALNPGQFAALRADPMKARAAFEEALRLETPVQTFFRTTTREVEIGGAAIPEGEKVPMLLFSANRDPRKWPEPDRYAIDRATAGHVAFGAGVHMCVGQLLARLEGETLLAAFARAFSAHRAGRRTGAALQQHFARLDEASDQGDCRPTPRWSSARRRRANRSRRLIAWSALDRQPPDRGRIDATGDT
jgi:cytochrome P450